jgi:hypothetical protein
LARERSIFFDVRERLFQVARALADPKRERKRTMTSRKALLNSLLRALLQEWGQVEVQAALARLSNGGGETAAPPLGRGSELTPRLQTKLLATEQVARARLSDSQAPALRELAARFDRKQFLPSVSDVREFLVMMGERPGAIKDRSTGFRLLLVALSELPQERLERLANSARHSGPSQLGPLSDAIAGVAASLPRHRDPSGS